jgi:uncharacterized membrane protein
LILATFNLLVHTRDAWTSVVPWGVGLSASVVILLVAGWIMSEMKMHETYEPADLKVRD